MTKIPTSFSSLLAVLLIISVLSGCETQQVATGPICNLKENEIVQIQISAEAGDPQAQYQLAEMYREGVCVIQDVSLALTYFHRSANQGNTDAQNQLGILYLQGGYGVDRDVPQGVSWYRKAASQGNADAARTLGNLYYWGGYMEKDIEEARKWYQLAVENGDLLSQKRLDAIHRGEDYKGYVANHSWLIGDWKGSVGDLSMILKIKEQDAEKFIGHASVYGSAISCKNSEVTLVPDKEIQNIINKYTISFSENGCRGRGTLTEEGIMLKGRIDFRHVKAANVALTKSGYESPDKIMENAGILLLCLNPWTFWLCQ